MALFVVRYYFSRDDYVQQMLEANSLEDAEHSVYQNVHPPHMVTAGEFPVFSNEGRIFLVARDHVRYCEILPAPGRRGPCAMRTRPGRRAAAQGKRAMTPIGS